MSFAYRIKLKYEDNYPLDLRYLAYLLSDPQGYEGHVITDFAHVKYENRGRELELIFLEHDQERAAYQWVSAYLLEPSKDIITYAGLDHDVHKFKLLTVDWDGLDLHAP